MPNHKNFCGTPFAVAIDRKPLSRKHLRRFRGRGLVVSSYEARLCVKY